MAPNGQGNPAKGTVAIMLDRGRFLKFDWESFERLEQKLGRGFLGGDGNAIAFRGFGELKAFIAEGLRHEDPNITEEQVGKMLELKKLREYSDAVSTAVVLALPENAEGKANTDPQPPAPAKQM